MSLYPKGSALDLVKDLPLFAREAGYKPRVPQPIEETILPIDPSIRIPNLCQDGLTLYIGLGMAGESTHPLNAECFEAWVFKEGHRRDQKPSIFEQVHRVSPELALLLAPGERVCTGFYTNLNRRSSEEYREFAMHLHRTPSKDIHRARATFITRD